MVRAGLYRERVTIQSRSATRNSFGERSFSFSEVATVWADVRPVSGREKLVSDTEIANTDYMIRIRYRTDVDTDKRLVLENGTVLDIENVTHDRRKTYNEIMAVERSNE